jgi:hypothetical protein
VIKVGAKTILIPILFLLFFSTVASAQYIYSCPYTISSPGYWEVKTDIFVWGDECIKITSSNVYLNLSGHKIYIKNQGIVYPIAIRIAPTEAGNIIENITVTNGKVISECNFYCYGVLVAWAKNVKLFGLNITSEGMGWAGDTYALDMRDYVFNSRVENVFLNAKNASSWGHNYSLSVITGIPGNVANNFFRRLNITERIFFNQHTSNNTLCESNFDPAKVEDYGTNNYITTGSCIFVPPPYCGNGICESGETYENCPEDCPYVPPPPPPPVPPAKVTYVEVPPPFWLIFIAVAVLCVIFEIMKRAGV